MKVISGGGGIDAQGRRYELPTVEREVSDDHFQRIRELFKGVPAPHQPSVGFVSPALYAALKGELDLID